MLFEFFKSLFPLAKNVTNEKPCPLANDDGTIALLCRYWSPTNVALQELMQKGHTELLR